MSVHIDIIFVGLIAFVSGSSFEPSSTTAFVVNAPGHQASVKFTGNVKLDSVNNSPVKCTPTSGGGKTVIDCVLDGIEISFDPPTNSGGLFPERPPREGIPTVGEDRSLGWVLRMSNIESGVGKIKGNIDQFIVGKLTFGWYLAESCELDSQEPEPGRRNRPALIGFRSKNIRSPHRQAVAECLKFGSRVPKSSFTIRLRKGATGRTIKVDCDKSSCLEMKVSNESSGRVSCDDDLEEGMHYKHYYALVDDPGAQLIPFSIDKKCRDHSDGMPPINPTQSAGELSILSPADVEFGLRGVRSLSADFEDAVRRILGRGWVPFKEVREALEKALLEERFKSLSAFRNVILNEFKARADVGDRVICPPTVLER